MDTCLFWPFGHLFKQDSEQPLLQGADRFSFKKNITKCLCLSLALGWAQQVVAIEVYVPDPKLTADDGWILDSFGAAVALSGDRLVVGAPGTDDFGISSGSAYVFEHDGANWIQTARLLAADGIQGDDFGRSISLSGDRLVVGTPWDDDNGTSSGSVYVFEYDGIDWVQAAKLLAADGIQGNEFGSAVSLDGDRLVVNAPGYGYIINSGAVYIFEYDGAHWVQTTKLTQPWADMTSFGHAVSLSGDQLAVGAPKDDHNWADTGTAFIYEYNGSDWIRRVQLSGNDVITGDRFGAAVSLSGDRLVVGAPEQKVQNTNRGSAYVFEKIYYFEWAETAKLLAADGQPEDFFGNDVSLSGDRVVVGAYGGFGTYSGSAYVFDYDGANWVETAELRAADDEGSFSYFGGHVSLSGDRVVVGAIDGGDHSHNGSAHVFRARNIVDPLVDLKVNGVDGPFTLDAAKRLTLSHQVWTGEATGIVDWWLFADAPDGTTWSWLSETKTWVPYISPAHPQSEIQDVLNQSFHGDTLNLPPGNYLIRGGLDLTPNDALDEPMYMDSLEINITDSSDP